MITSGPPVDWWPVLALMSSLVWSDFLVWLLSDVEHGDLSYLIHTGIPPPWSPRYLLETGGTFFTAVAFFLLIATAWAMSVPLLACMELLTAPRNKTEKMRAAKRLLNSDGALWFAFAVLLAFLFTLLYAMTPVSLLTSCTRSYSYRYNSSFPPRPSPAPPAPAPAPAPPAPSDFISLAANVTNERNVAERLFLRHCDEVLFGTPVPSLFWKKQPDMDNRDSTFIRRNCPPKTTRIGKNGDGGGDRFMLSPIASPAFSLSPWNSSFPRLKVEPAPNCATGVGVFEILSPARIGDMDSIRSEIQSRLVAIRSLDPEWQHGNFVIALVDNGGTCPDESKCCDFTRAGDTNLAAQLVLIPNPSGTAGNTQQQLRHNMFQILPGNEKAHPTPPSPPEPVPPEYDVPVALDAHASINHKGDQVSVRVVNPTARPIQARLNFGGNFVAAAVKATILTSGSLHDDNPVDDQRHVYPTPFPVELEPGGSKTTSALWFPPHSFVSMQFVQSETA